MRVPSITQLRAGPPSTDLMTAAAVLGIGRTRAYALARDSQFPVPVIRIGSTYRVPVAALLDLLGISETDPVPAGHRTEPAAPARRYSQLITDSR